jgi:hypothetical protein
MEPILWLVLGVLVGCLPFIADARRYRVLREELVDRWVMGETIRSPGHLDARVDGGELYRPPRQLEPRDVPTAISNMPGPQPLFGGAPWTTPGGNGPAPRET